MHGFFFGGPAWQRHRGPRWGPFGFPFEGFGGERRGGPFPRVDRGDVKILVLSVLMDGPKHGYEVMRAIEARSGSAYAPSPGVVYPTLQMLEDLGHVRASQGGERKVYELTDAGRGYLAENKAAEQEAWAQFEGHGWQSVFPGFGTEEQRQVRDEMVELGKSLFAGGRIFRADAAKLARVRDALRNARQQVDGAFADYL